LPPSCGADAEVVHVADLPARFQPHTVTVSTRVGVTGAGEVFADPVPVKCWRDDEVRLVRDADGQQVVSSTTLYTSDPRDLWAPGSVVDVDGRDATVIAAARHDDAGMGVWQHTEIVLT
jgi:hypothetical protein